MFGSEAEAPTSRRTILAAALLAAIVIAGIVLTLMILLGGDSNSPTGPDPGDATQSQTAASICGLPPEESQEPPTEPPEVDKWGGSGRLLAPLSDRYGPGRVENGVHSCFSKGPIGALFAAVNMAADVSNPTVTASEIRKRLLDPSRAEEVVGGGAPSSSGDITWVGFRFVNYAPGEAASISLALSVETPQGEQLFATTVDMRWSNGDWKAVVPRGESSMTRLANLEGYVKWGPKNG